MKGNKIKCTEKNKRVDDSETNKIISKFQKGGKKTKKSSKKTMKTSKKPKKLSRKQK